MEKKEDKTKGMTGQRRFISVVTGLPCRFAVGAFPILGTWHSEAVDIVFDVSEVYSASIFEVEVG
jgi:hypothetical protein